MNYFDSNFKAFTYHTFSISVLVIAFKSSSLSINPHQLSQPYIIFFKSNTNIAGLVLNLTFNSFVSELCDIWNPIRKIFIMHSTAHRPQTTLPSTYLQAYFFADKTSAHHSSSSVFSLPIRYWNKLIMLMDGHQVSF